MLTHPVPQDSLDTPVARNYSYNVHFTHHPPPAGHFRGNMYWESFGFKEPPFALTPNPAFLFLSAPHQEAFAHLLFAIENRAGFIELSGEVGTGKTTIVRTLLNQLDPETHRTALIFNPILSPIGFMKEVNAEFGLS